MKNIKLLEHFNCVETTKEHNGYTYSVGRALTIVILGSLCGLREISKIHQWAKSQHVMDFLKDNFGILSIPCYYWLLTLLKLIKPESLNQHFTAWATTLLPESLKDMTISFDGKTIRSTGKMRGYDKPLHILSAHLAEVGLTISQKTVDIKKNEIPAMRELLNLVDISGCMVVADALHCQIETAEKIVDNGGDYLLNIKDNQKSLKEDIEDYVQDSELRANMNSATTREKNGGRIERRSAFTTDDIGWLESKTNWKGMSCFGAINTRFTQGGKTTNEWHYYISSRNLVAEDLLKYSRNEWSIESMHWLLDVHFGEDFCRVHDKNVNQNLNIIRKVALNYLRNYKNESGTKLPFSKIMFGCLLDCEMILTILGI